jgi:probable HAF family extracellular repeat protein
MQPIGTIARRASQLCLALLLLALFAAPAPAAPAAAGSSRLRIVDLGTLNGGCCSFATGINDRGEVVGSSVVEENTSHAFLWRRGHLTDLGTLGGPNSGAAGINDHGEVVGTSDLPDGGPLHATLWRRGRVIDLGTLGG